MNTQKKHWNIILKSNVTNGSYNTIYGTEKQAIAFDEIMHSGIIIEPSKNVIDLDNLKFLNCNGTIECISNGKALFQFQQENEGEIIILDEDNDLTVDIDLFMCFPNFIGLAICELCNGSGRYSTDDGGVHETHVCDCQDVILSI